MFSPNIGEIKYSIIFLNMSSRTHLVILPAPSCKGKWFQLDCIYKICLLYVRLSYRIQLRLPRVSRLSQLGWHSSQRCNWLHACIHPSVKVLGALLPHPIYIYTVQPTAFHKSTVIWIYTSGYQVRFWVTLSLIRSRDLIKFVVMEFRGLGYWE